MQGEAKQIDTTRLKILQAMGIDVWFQRPTPTELASRLAQTPSTARVVAPVERARREPSRRRVEAVHAVEAVDAKQVGERLPATAVPSEAAMVAQAPALSNSDPQAAPFALLCFRNSTAILIAAPVVRTRQRLARDILDSIALLKGAATGSVQMADFSYPPQQQVREGEGVAPPDRVLRAFLGRQLTGMSQPHVLICADALSRFAGWFAQPHRVIPPLDDLYGDAGRKRSLWQDLLNG